MRNSISERAASGDRCPFHKKLGGDDRCRYSLTSYGNARKAVGEGALVVVRKHAHGIARRPKAILFMPISNAFASGDAKLDGIKVAYTLGDIETAHGFQ